MAGNASLDGMVLLGGGSFAMGAEDAWAYPDDGEGPVRDVRIGSFWIDACAVSNAQFASSSESTGLRDRGRKVRVVIRLRWLTPRRLPADAGGCAGALVAQGRGADWRHPDGPHSSIDGRLDHPSCTSPGTTPRRTAPGQGRGSRPRPNGSSLHAGARAAGVPLGRRTRARRRAPDERLARRLPEREYRRRRLLRDLPGRHVPRRTGSASTTPPATSGSGRPTGFIPRSGSAIRPSTRRVRREARARCKRAGPISATTRTVGGTGSPRATPARPTARRATRASAACGTSSRPCGDAFSPVATGDTSRDGIKGRRAPLRARGRGRTGRVLPSTGSRPRLAWAARRGGRRGAVGARDRARPRPGARRLAARGDPRSLVRHRVLERIAAELAASGELERLVNAALASPQTLELTDKVLASDQTQRALGHVASSPELRDAIARQTAGLADEVIGGVRASAARLDDRAEQVVRRPREPSVLSTAGSRRARSRSRPTQR